MGEKMQSPSYAFFLGLFLMFSFALIVFSHSNSLARVYLMSKSVENHVTDLNTESSIASSKSSNSLSAEFLVNMKNISQTDGVPEYNFTITKIFVNPLNETIHLNIEKGFINYDFQDEGVKHVLLIDNFGNSYTPIWEDSTIQNPPIDIDVLPLSTFKLILKIEPLYYDFRILGILLHFNFTLKAPEKTRITMAFPKDYTLFDYSSGGTETYVENHILLTWFGEGTIYLYATFLPFHTDVTDIERWRVTGILTRRDLRIEISQVFPSKAVPRVWVTEVREVPYLIGDYKINPLVSLRMPIPGGVNTTVVNIKDGVGYCSRVSRPIENITADTVGSYYVDYPSDEVIIYPRFHFREKFYEYSVEACFDVPTEDALREINFYTFQSHVILTKFRSNPFEIEKVAQNVVKFLLPNNVAIQNGQPMGFITTEEDGKPVIYWIFTDSLNLPEEEYIVTFEIRPIKNAFFLGISSGVFTTAICLALQIYVLSRPTSRQHIALIIAIITIMSTYLIGYLHFLYQTEGMELAVHPYIAPLWILPPLSLILVPIVFKFVGKVLPFFRRLRSQAIRAPASNEN